MLASARSAFNIQWTNEEMKKSDERIAILFNSAETTGKNNER